MKRSRLAATFVLGAASALGIGREASAVTLADMAVFSEKRVVMGTNVIVHDGGVGSNDALELVNLGNGGEFLLVTGGGTLSVGTSASLVGNIVFNDDVEVGNGTVIIGNIDTPGDVKIGTNAQVLKDAGVGGNITAGGNVNLGNGSTVEGDILAGGDVKTGTNVNVQGNIGSNGTVQVGNGSTIDGSIRYGEGDTFSQGTGVALGSTPVEGPDTPVNPATFAPLALPSANLISPGLDNHSVGNGGSLSLDPGAYNNVSTGTNAELFLSSGRYDLSNLTLGNGSDIYIDLSSGSPLSIFIAEDLKFGTGISMFIRSEPAGVFHSFSEILDDLSLKPLIESIYWEVHGNVQVGNGSEWLGTLFQDGVGDDDVKFGTSTNIYGAIYSTNKIDLGNGTQVHFAMADFLQPPDIQDQTPGAGAVPEPVSAVLGLASLAALGAAATRRRRG